jgi:hypothetical protein
MIKWILAMALCAGISTAQSPTLSIEPAGPDMMNQVPVLYFGVRACGSYVIWLMYDDGHMRRVDKDHSPKDIEGFIKVLQDSKIPSDTVVVRCSENL